MSRPLLLSAVLATLALAACSNPSVSPPPGAPPVSNASRSSQGMPQSPNSLPDGSRVNAPVAPATGDVGTTRVTPGR